MDVIRIDENHWVIDHFLVQERNGVKYIKHFTNSDRYLDQYRRHKVNLMNTINLKKLSSEYPNTSIIPCQSKLIFDHVQTFTYEFYRKGEGLFKVNARTPRRFRDISSPFTVIPFFPKAGPAKYLYYQNNSLQTNVIPPAFNRIIHSHNSSFFVKTLCLENIKLKTSDIEILLEYQPVKSIYQNLSVEMATRTYKDVREEYKERPFIRSFTSRDTKEPFPKQYRSTTFSRYAKSFAFILYLIDNFRRFSFGTPRICNNLPIPLFNIDSTIEERTEKYSDFFCYLYESKDKALACINILFRVMAFDWNRSLETKYEVKTLSHFKSTIDTFKGISIYLCLHRHIHPTDKYSNTDKYFITDCTTVWDWIKKIYSILLTEYRTTKVISKPCAPDGYLIGGLRFSRQYIQIFYQDIINRYDSNLEVIKKSYLNVQAPSVMGRKLLGTQGLCLEDDRANHKGSLVNLFPMELISKFLPYLSTAQIVEEEAKQEIKSAIDDMGVCLMWLIYFSTGGPYRFPDLQIIKYAGNERNIFFDATGKCIELDTTYSKFRISKRLCKVVDQHTTFYLVHYILVCRSLLNNILGDFYAEINRDLFASGRKPNSVADDERNNVESKNSMGNVDEDEDEEESNQLFDEEEDAEEDADENKDDIIVPPINIFNEGKNLTDLDYSRQILHSTLFIDINTNKIVHYERFKKFISQYPSSWEGKRLTFRDMRHGMIGLLREYVASGYNERFELSKEEYAGHDANTGYTDYAVNPYKARHTPISKRSEVLSKLWQEWLGLRTYHEKKKFTPLHRTKEPKLPTLTQSLYDIAYVRSSFFYDSRCLSEQENMLLLDIYMGQANLHPIQISPKDDAFNWYKLPIYALSEVAANKNQISFIFEPTLSAKILALQKLSEIKSSLKVGGFDSIENIEFGPEEHDFKYSIYVGTFENLLDRNFCDLIHKWDETMVKLSLCYLVINGFEKVNEDLIKDLNIGSIKWFFKILLFTKVDARHQTKILMKNLGILKQLISVKRIDISECIYYHNLLKELPLKDVYKELWKEESGYGTLQKCCSYSKRYLQLFNSRTNKKIVIISKQADAADALHAMLGDISIKITEKIDIRERFRLMDTFREQPNSKILIGTKVLLDFPNVENVALVLLMDYMPTISDYITFSSMITKENGIISSIFCEGSFEKDSMTLDCPTNQIRKFYGISETQPCNCCNNSNERVRELLIEVHSND
ncbi:uncharacterized protein NDAI_0C00100 [Naumovozyma dairenensis CBS 421]|uniref:Sir1 ORC-binding domain-containing protein n=1 Tax=Naumovozyma dairenensis (strain ATCC 10597 / BCRC 20456 / CBS 421 / NBRC 0211 / NRRL Y-12639) TaxID=1071378 RepID=G0W7A9_NAUDC|nr:hypothetical protein NDAI_0C00100 [Naumovozyma dairenensis CBS 421]CCD23670.1 hypothetical protein NDAI_0C00100 [Naumovozyma dairenensis CBS 421]